MKIYTSNAPLSQDLKDALSAEGARDDFLKFLNGRVAGDAKTFELHLGDKTIAIAAEPTGHGNRESWTPC
jgi:hypothetical protein